MRIAVGMSGGVDSSSTAKLLKENGHDVLGVTMLLFDHQKDEIEQAKLASLSLNIPHYIFDYREAFKASVINNFVEEYENGHTPNPCLVCNRLFKYGRLIEDSFSLGAEAFATGHYARVFFNDATKEYEVHSSRNLKKDQSYNLYHLNQEILSKLYFPLGEFNSKDEVRSIFSITNDKIASKKDSLGICFIQNKNHSLFLKSINSKAMKSGSFVDMQGNLLGYHNGIALYTLGQKRGLGDKLSGKFVVVNIDSKSNQIILGKEENLYKKVIISDEFNLINKNDTFPLEVQVKISQWSEVYTGTLDVNIDFEATVELVSAARAPSKGQAIVCYSGTRLIGGGIISSCL